MAKFKYLGENNKFHLKDDKDKEPLKKDEVYDITIKRAEEANDKYGDVFERVDKE